MSIERSLVLGPQQARPTAPLTGPHQLGAMADVDQLGSDTETQQADPDTWQAWIGERLENRITHKLVLSLVCFLIPWMFR